MMSEKGDAPKMPPEVGSAKSAAGRSRTACAACRLSRRFCDRAMPCARCKKMSLLCVPALPREKNRARKRPLPAPESDTVSGGGSVSAPTRGPTRGVAPAAAPQIIPGAPTSTTLSGPRVCVDFVEASGGGGRAVGYEEPSVPTVLSPHGRRGGGLSRGPSPLPASVPVQASISMAQGVDFIDAFRSASHPDAVASTGSAAVGAWAAWEEQEVRAPSIPPGGGVESLSSGRRYGDEVGLGYVSHSSVQHGPQGGQKGEGLEMTQDSHGASIAGMGGGARERQKGKGDHGTEGGSVVATQEIIVQRPVAGRDHIEVAYEAACRATVQLSLEEVVDRNRATLVLTGLEFMFTGPGTGTGFVYPAFLCMLRHCISLAEPARPLANSLSASDSASTAMSFLVHHVMAVADPHYKPAPWDPSSYNQQGGQAKASAGPPSSSRAVSSRPPSSRKEGQRTNCVYGQQTQGIVPEVSWINQLWDDPTAGACSFALVVINGQPIQAVGMNAFMATNFADEKDMAMMADQFKTLPIFLLARFMTRESSVEFFTLLSKNTTFLICEDTCVVQMVDRRGNTFPCMATARWNYGPQHVIVGTRFKPLTNRPQQYPPSPPFYSFAAAPAPAQAYQDDDDDLSFLEDMDVPAFLEEEALLSATAPSPQHHPSVLHQGAVVASSRPQPSFAPQKEQRLSPRTAVHGGYPSVGTPPFSAQAGTGSPLSFSPGSRALLTSWLEGSGPLPLSPSTWQVPPPILPPSAVFALAPPNGAPPTSHPYQGPPVMGLTGGAAVAYAPYPQLGNGEEAQIDTAAPYPQLGNGEEEAPDVVLNEEEMQMLMAAIK